MPQQIAIERAFQLARDGTCRSIEDMRRKLKAEGFCDVERHLADPPTKRQLIEAMKWLD